MTPATEPVAKAKSPPKESQNKQEEMSFSPKLQRESLGGTWINSFFGESKGHAFQFHVMMVMIDHPFTSTTVRHSKTTCEIITSAKLSNGLSFPLVINIVETTAITQLKREES